MQRLTQAVENSQLDMEKVLHLFQHDGYDVDDEK